MRDGRIARRELCLGLGLLRLSVAKGGRVTLLGTQTARRIHLFDTANNVGF